MPNDAEPVVANTAERPTSRRAARLSLVLIVLIAILHGLACRFVADTMSATFDEPMHAFSGALIVQHGDFRAGFDHPPLVHLLAGLAQTGSGATIDPDAPYTRLLAQRPTAIWNAAVEQLYHRADIDGVALVDRARLPMAGVAAIGVLLVGLTARWLVGPLAGVLAALLMALDPSFLAHGGLVKNDVPTAAAYIGVAWLAAAMMRRITWPRILSLGILSGLALLTKFSALLLIGVFLAAFLIRALSNQPWQTGCGQTLLATRRARLERVVATTAITLLLTYAIIWAGYGFAFHASPLGEGDPIQPGDLLALYMRRADRVDLPTSIRFLQWVNDQRLLPEAFVNGLIYQEATLVGRVSYVLGQRHFNGDWYYFPVALLVKLPLGTLALLGVASAFFVHRLRRRESHDAGHRSASLLFAAIVLIYLAVSIRTPLNIGVRHLFPIYPFLCVAAGAAAAVMIRRRGAWRAATIVLIAGTAAESAIATPDDLSFVNVAARAVRPADWWLGDSNVDWGQGLRALAAWQRAGHDDRPLYLGYLGIADPAAYGVRYVNLPNGDPQPPTLGLNQGGYAFGPAEPAPDFDARPGYLALSISDLQGLTAGVDPYRLLASRPRIATLAGAIVVYDTRDPAVMDLFRSTASRPSTTAASGLR